MLMRLLSRYWLLIPLLLLVLIVRDWVETTPSVIDVEDTIDMQATQSDYYLEEFKTRKFDTTGNIEYEVSGKTLAHYPIDDRSEITAPSVTMHRDTIKWTIDSVSGELQKNPAIFTLQGNVIVKRASSDAEPIVIRTDELAIHTDNNEVRTDKPIEIVADSWKLRSVGLQTSLDEGKLNLLSAVTGRYEVGESE